MTISSPVCSAAPCSSTSSPPCQIMPNGGSRSFYLSPKDFDCSYDLRGRRFLRLSTDRGLQRVAFRVQALKDPMEFMGNSIEQLVRIPSLDARDGSYSMGTLHFQFVENPEVPAPDPDVEFIDSAEQSVDTGLTSVESVDTESVLAFDEASKGPVTSPESLSVDNDLLYGLKSSIKGSSGVNDLSSINEAIEKVENTLRSTYDSAVSYVDAIFKRATTTIDSSVDQIGTSAANRYANFSSDLKEAANQAAAASVDALRSTVVVLEDSLTKGASFIVYSYNSSKELLPPQFRESLRVFEENAAEFGKPVGVAGQQAYLAVEQLKRALGLDPSDPLVPFLLFLGMTSAFWALYWAWTYGGYSGDLSPKLTLEMLMGKEGAALIDVRPEVLRETQGIPDLRRAARFRYSSVSLPEVNGSLRSLVTSWRDLEDSLTAVVIRNMKIVQDRSKVILIDRDGSRAKGIARALTKLGIKRSYLVQGGFQSWVKEGLRIKELKTETALTVINEEAEAILAEINPSPLQLVAYGLVLLAAIYAIIGKCHASLALASAMTLTRSVFELLEFLRVGDDPAAHWNCWNWSDNIPAVGSYENLDGIKDDLRLLGVPAKLGAQVFSWAAGKLETNSLKLPTSPSSSDVQSRVLQAATKHESQPSADVEKAGLTQESFSPGGDGADLLEA